MYSLTIFKHIEQSSDNFTKYTNINKSWLDVFLDILETLDMNFWRFGTPYYELCCYFYISISIYLMFYYIKKFKTMVITKVFPLIHCKHNRIFCIFIARCVNYSLMRKNVPFGGFFFVQSNVLFYFAKC